MIQRAQIKQNYAKLKKQGKLLDDERAVPDPYVEDGDHAPTTLPHPDRQALMDQEENGEAESAKQVDRGRGARRAKHVPFQREYAQAQQRRKEAEEHWEAGCTPSHMPADSQSIIYPVTEAAATIQGEVPV